MDIVKALRDLYTEKKRLDAAIASLEARIKSAKSGASSKPGTGAKSGTGQRRRGRKSMSAAERLEVSRRMSLYWEARRAQQLSKAGSPPSPPSPDREANAREASATSAS
jgi:cell division septum initiation protein DivIVA